MDRARTTEDGHDDRHVKYRPYTKMQLTVLNTVS